jgi:hypothetical protein
LPSPAANLVHRIELMAFDILAEVPQIIDTIVDWEGRPACSRSKVVSQGECSRHTVLSKLSSFAWPTAVA